MLGAVAFVPVAQAFEDEVINYPNFPLEVCICCFSRKLLHQSKLLVLHLKDARPLVNFIEETWIGQPIPNSNLRHRPTFRNELWNVYDLVVADLPRTTNSMEVWHRDLSAQIPCHDPPLWECLRGLHREQRAAALKREQCLEGILHQRSGPNPSEQMTKSGAVFCVSTPILPSFHT